MNKRGKFHLAILLFSILILIIVFFIFLATRPTTFDSPAPQTLENCHTIKADNSNGIDFVFLTPDKKTAEEYTDFILQTTPYNEYSDRLNFRYVEAPDAPCNVYRNIALLCDDPKINELAASCPHDFIMTIKKGQSHLRSSALKNSMSIVRESAMSVVTHELGHALVGLAEEYTPASLSRDQENCKSSCDFGELGIGCSIGCSEADFYRSSPNSVMRTLSSNDYDPYNTAIIERYLEENTQPISQGITGSVISPIIDCKNEKYYEIIYDPKSQQTISSIKTGCAPKKGGQGPDSTILISENGDSIYKTQYLLTLFTESQGEDEIEGEIIELENLERQIIFTIPKISEVKNVEISKDQIPIIQLNLNEVGALACIV